ncbi:perlucin-like protein isoform X2 [Oculina patagonica]
MKTLAPFLPFYIVSLCAISGVSALPSTQNGDILKVLQIIAETLGHPCPSGWTRFNNYCYLVSRSSKSWSDAQTYCRSLGGDLVKINSAEENEFVLQLVRQKAPSVNHVWIGLKWYPNAFYWNDFSVPGYKNWAPGEPNGKDIKLKCGRMWIGPWKSLPQRASGYWNDGPCFLIEGWPKGIVCKKLP